MEYSAEIYQLNEAFMRDYPEDEFPELMHKLGRPYSCLLIDTHEDYFICIPFRSHINHRNSFMFHGTQRSMKSKSGLDYTKIVLIKDEKYFDDKKAIVDQDEYNEVQIHLGEIVEEAVNYVNGYIAHVEKIEEMHPREFERKYKYSTLPYFHDILKI